MQPLTPKPEAQAQSQAQSLRIETQYPSILLMGMQGHGKTHSIRTLLDSGIKKVVVLSLEPGIADNLGDFPAERVTWHYINPYGISLLKLKESYKKMSMMNAQALADAPAIDRQNYPEFMEILDTLNNFPCDRTGELLGSITAFPDDWALVLDSLTGLTHICTRFTVGAKAQISQFVYPAIYQSIRDIINCCVGSTRCLFIMTAHTERELDEETKTSIITISTLGRKLAPTLGRFFSDVILTYRVKDQFYWKTMSSEVQLKSRSLPLSENLPPTFKPLLENFRAKLLKGSKT